MTSLTCLISPAATPNSFRIDSPVDPRCRRRVPSAWSRKIGVSMIVIHHGSLTIRRLVAWSHARRGEAVHTGAVCQGFRIVPIVFADGDHAQRKRHTLAVVREGRLQQDGHRLQVAFGMTSCSTSFVLKVDRHLFIRSIQGRMRSALCEASIQPVPSRSIDHPVLVVYAF